MDKAAFLASCAAVLTLIYFILFREYLFGVIPLWFIYGAPAIVSVVSVAAIVGSFVEKKRSANKS